MSASITPCYLQVEETDFDGGDGVRVGMLGRVVMVGEEDTDGGVIGSLRRRTTPNRQSLLYFEPIPGETIGIHTHSIMKLRILIVFNEWGALL